VRFKSLKGVHDILPSEIELWQHIEETSKKVFHSYGYKELRIPIIETTDIFIRSIGETTDIVEKEMYTFTDRGGRSITLRPEGTAPLVRAFIEHHLYNQSPPQKFYYSGPMFRYERPQAGRLRQFYQIGVEALGTEDPKLDAEVLSMLKLLLHRLDLKGLSFEINSIGCIVCRPDYRTSLKGFLKNKLHLFCGDCQRRYEINPMRVLDCKVHSCIHARGGVPRITEYLCDDCREHFESVKKYLNTMHIPYSINPDMVRGLDYYTKTTFEVTASSLGAQKAVAAGGRYDRLVEDFGGPSTPGIGFALGMERIVSLIKDGLRKLEPSPLFIASHGKEASEVALTLAEELRNKGLVVEISYEDASLRSQLRKADKIGARHVLILGEEELKAEKIILRDMETKEQKEIPISVIPTLVPALSGIGSGNP